MHGHTTCWNDLTTSRSTEYYTESTNGSIWVEPQRWSLGDVQAQGSTNHQHLRSFSFILSEGNVMFDSEVTLQRKGHHPLTSVHLNFTAIWQLAVVIHVDKRWADGSTHPAHLVKFERFSPGGWNQSPFSCFALIKLCFHTLKLEHLDPTRPWIQFVQRLGVMAARRGCFPRGWWAMWRLFLQELTGWNGFLTVLLWLLGSSSNTSVMMVLLLLDSLRLVNTTCLVCTSGSCRQVWLITSGSRCYLQLLKSLNGFSLWIDEARSCFKLRPCGTSLIQNKLH